MAAVSFTNSLRPTAATRTRCFTTPSTAPTVRALQPVSKLVMNQAGNLYGTQYGGEPLTNKGRLLFKLAPGNGGWTFTDLHDFNFTDGSSPDGDLVVDGSGNLYGTTAGGGPSNGGVIWEITP